MATEILKTTLNNGYLLTVENVKACNNDVCVEGYILVSHTGLREYGTWSLNGNLLMGCSGQAYTHEYMLKEKELVKQTISSIIRDSFNEMMEFGNLENITEVLDKSFKGRTIQFKKKSEFSIVNEWRDTTKPSWVFDENIYRVKPKEKFIPKKGDAIIVISAKKGFRARVFHRMTEDGKYEVYAGDMNDFFTYEDAYPFENGIPEDE